MAGIALHVFWIPALSRHESFFPQAKAGCVFTDFHSRNRKSARREQPS
jgi:predicted adenine nucleotide alpha hydrolase (AANH) superfamily ATPase